MLFLNLVSLIPFFYFFASIFILLTTLKNPSFFQVNVALLLLVLSANVFPLYLIYYCKKMKKLKARPIEFQMGQLVGTHG